MLVTNDAALVGNGHHEVGVVIQDDTLTSQAAFQSRIDGAVNEVLLFFGDFFEKFSSFFHINVASRAGAHPAAIVVKVDVELFGYLQDRASFKIAGYRPFWNRFIFKQKAYSSHSL